MKFNDMLIICLRNLWRRKGRTMLTVVGVVIGSCAVIVMISLGLGMSKAMDGMLDSWGDLTAVTIRTGGYMGEGSTNKDRPKLDDKAVAALEGIEHVSCAIKRLTIDSQMVTIAMGRNDRYRLAYADLVGIDFSMLDQMKYEAEKGKLPEEGETENIILMGTEIPYQFSDTKKHGQAAYTYKQMLPDGTYTQPFLDPLENKVKIAINNTKKPNQDGTFQYGGKGYEFNTECVAILAQDAQWETPYTLFIDLSFARQIISDYNRLNGVKKASDPEYNSVKLMVDDLANVDAVQKAVEDMGFSATSMAQIRNEMQGSLGTIELVLGCLAGISLLVAAISITNTMIMSIYERTKEIGIMKVLGCFIGNIRMIFLMEAGLIGLLGGIIGTVISFGISAVMNSLMGSGISEMMGIYNSGTESEVSIIPIWLVLLALAFSTLIGLISGYYPANRAVKISALEAIRNE